MNVLKTSAALLIAALLCGCTSLAITAPATGTTVSEPQAIVVTESVGLDGHVNGALAISVDGTPTEHFNNVTYSVPSGATLCCLEPGAHTVTATGQTSSSSLTASSSFTVAACPGCYACPAGKAHPVIGVCCDNGSCDVPVSSNFGPWRFPTQTCTSPTSLANDCMNQNANALCGANGTGCSGLSPSLTQMVAVSFTANRTGVLKQIHAPIGWRSGANAFEAWITDDAGGKPGAVLESFTLSNLRSQAFPTQSAMHIFSVAHPTLASGTTYWLVIGPAAANAVGSWNYSLDDAPSAGGANFLVNATPDANGIPRLAGPWVASNGPLRPAFEVDLR